MIYLDLVSIEDDPMPPLINISFNINIWTSFNKIENSQRGSFKKIIHNLG